MEEYKSKTKGRSVLTINDNNINKEKRCDGGLIQRCISKHPNYKLQKGKRYKQGK